VLCALGLAAVGLSVTGVVGIDLFRSYLVDQSGQQLTTVARTLAGSHGDRPITEALNCGDLPNDNAVELIGFVPGPATNVFASCGATVGQSTALPPKPSAAVLDQAAESGQPFTETGTAGTAEVEWQLVVVQVPIRVDVRPQQSPAQTAKDTAYNPSPPVTTSRSAPGYVLAATPLTGVDSTVSHLADLDLAVDAAVGLALLGLGYVLVRRTLRPLRRIETAAAAISAGDLARRVPPGHPKTETGRLSSALNGMLAQIESAFGAQAGSEAEALRSEAHMRRFAADAGHELRTPLASIRGITELYRQGMADSRQLPDLIGRIEGEAIRMSLLVEDLLLLARLGEARPQARDRVHLVALAADSITAARSRARDRAIELCVEWPQDGAEQGCEPVVIGDENRLRQAVDNLLTNAAHHTPAGTPVTVRVRPGDEPGHCLLEVEDEGPGLSEQDAARVFERFYRADRSRARTTAQQGSGLGLAIVAAIAGAHGGTASVRSGPGPGACFTLDLPQAAATDAGAL
jgi:two-component system OmpR family sensor kinase